MAEPTLTRYRMLKSSDGATWTLVGHQDAHNADAAVRKFFGLIENDVQVVAVTERSWRPLVRTRRIVESFVNAPVEADEPADVPEASHELDPVGAV